MIYKIKQLQNYHKNKLSPCPKNQKQKHNKTAKAFLFAPLRASLAMEAILVLPLFVFAMTALLQYGKVMESAVQVGTALCETSELMGAAAYLKCSTGEGSKVPKLAATVLSAAAGQTMVMKKVRDTSAMKNVNMAQSSFPGQSEMVDLVFSYQIRSPVSMIALPFTFYIQRARVRAWTGREGGSSAGDNTGSADGTNGDKVYVTATGTVYHKDSNCSYLRPSVRAVSASVVGGKRNSSGAKYHPCEMCGTKNPSGTVYITNDGTRYHTDKNCSGLKRTISVVSTDEVGEKHACSKCG